MSQRRASSVGRNKPCPCGSGNKQKKCHGAPIPEPPRQGAVPITLPLRHLGGERENLIMATGSALPGGWEPDPRGRPGKYIVSFELATEPTDRAPRFDRHTGDSWLAFAVPDTGAQDRLRIDVVTPTEVLVFKGLPNQHRRLGLLQTELEAESFVDAKQRAFRALMPTLSSWAVLLDIPVKLGRVHVLEVTTGSKHVDWPSPHIARHLALPPEGTLGAEFRGYSSIYREALSTDSEVYRFLCFYKILEALRSRRERIAKEMRERGETPAFPVERVPTDPVEFVPWLAAIFGPRAWEQIELEGIFRAELRGWKFSRVVDDKLRPLRDKVAHALVGDAGELTLSADELLHVEELAGLLPLVRCMCRHMLLSEFPVEFGRSIEGLSGPASPSQ